MFCKFLHEDSTSRTNEVYHDVANEKSYKIETKRNFGNAYSGHLFIHFLGYTRYATSYWKNAKGPMQFHEKLRPGEALERAWFGDIRLIGMYFLGDSSHMVRLIARNLNMVKRNGSEEGQNGLLDDD